MHIASEEGYIVIALMLIIKGANVNAKDSFGLTPLHQAASFGQNLILNILLKNGANLEAEDNLGRTPLACSSEQFRYMSQDS